MNGIILASVLSIGRHADLVRAGDETQVVFLQERMDDVSAERVGHTTIVLSPASDVLKAHIQQPVKRANVINAREIADTGRLLDNSRIAKSRTGRLADWSTRGCHRRLCVLSFPFWWHLRDREMSSPRVDNPRVGVSAICPVTHRATSSFARTRVYRS